MWRYSLINLDQQDEEAFEITYGLEMIRIQVVCEISGYFSVKSFGMSCENNIYHICVFNVFLMIL